MTLPEASSATVQVDATQQGHAVSPLLWGIFFEEINHAGQGGLYSQLVSNTNFEYVDFYPWTPQSSANNVYLSLSQDQPMNYKNLQHLQVSFTSAAATGAVGINNPGFFGMTFEANAQYTVSLFSYADSAQPLPADATFFIALLDGSGNSVAKSSPATIARGGWAQFRTTLTAPSNTVVNGSLSIIFSSSLVTPTITLHFDVISLLPVEGWHGLPFIRSDLGQMIYDLSPAFVRFPGGCYVEGDTLDHRFNWKNTIGALETRPGHYDLWDYYSEDGLGFLEYLLFIEQLSTAQGTYVEPIWVINNGVSHADSIPTQDIYPWIVDALESLDFAMGDSSTKYGAMRAALGHPAPFPINIMAIGNEDCGKPYYLENYKEFYTAIKQAYPNMTLIANCDLTSSGGKNELWDFHTYQNTQWFFDNLKQWDSYSRSAAKVFESEYAVTSGCGQGNVNAGIAEAAYMTGLERNSDVVLLASYAPLLVNANDRKWNPDAIVFNSYQAYGTPSYWVQHMFSNAQKDTAWGTQYVLPSTSSGSNYLAVSSTIATLSSISTSYYIIVKAVNYDTANALNLNVSLSLKSGLVTGGVVQVQSLYSASVNDENTFQNPQLIAPKDSTVSIVSNAFSLTLPPYSAHIFRVLVSN